MRDINRYDIYIRLFNVRYSRERSGVYLSCFNRWDQSFVKVIVQTNKTIFWDIIRAQGMNQILHDNQTR